MGYQNLNSMPEVRIKNMVVEIFCRFEHVCEGASIVTVVVVTKWDFAVVDDVVDIVVVVVVDVSLISVTIPAIPLKFCRLDC